jgi:hypothetical protein
LSTLLLILGSTWGWMALLALLVLGAWRRGDHAAQLATAACVAAWLASLLLQDRRDWLGPQWGMFAVDAALFAALLAIGLRSDRLWTLFAAGFQLLAVSLHLAFALARHVWSPAYFVGLQVSSYLVLAAIAVGVLTTRAR